MAIRDLLSIVGADTQASTPYAFWLAAACGARLTASALVVEPDLPLHVSLELPQDWLDSMREEAAREAARVLRLVSEAAEQSSLPVEILPYRTSTGEAERDAGRLARYYDATILQQPDPDGLDTSPIIEAVLFESGRPVIVVPYISAHAELKTALVAWDGGHTAARAIGDAIPVLALAKRIEILTIDKSENETKLRSAERLAQHLSRHGIKAEPKQIVSEIDVASTLLSHAADVEADLLVMGAYGHSRLREIILGGTTRDILQSMTLPVLMSH